MRPLHGDDTWATRQRQRAARLNDRDAHLTSPSTASNYVSFCIADEASLDSHRGRSMLPTHSGDPRKLPEPFPTGDQDRLVDDATPCSPLSRASFLSQSSVSLLSQAQPSSLSRPITPMMLGSSCVSFTGSSSSSRRNSFASSLSDDAVGYDRESAGEPVSAPSMLDSGSAPQLVMPSINMPSRRPFTETGKSLGRLKILLAGDSGVGKTSLMKAIVQTCDHIVHVDPISPVNEPSQASSRPDIMSVSSKRQSLSTTAISEVYASTKPYPEWWLELDTPSASHKRKRRDDHVLERNICFVDTPGYSCRSSVMETIMPCVDYVESHLSKVLSDDLSEADLMNMLGGDGGCQVDVVLYLVSRSLKPADLEYIRRLTLLTNVIPILSRAEALSEQQTAAYKQRIATQLDSAGIRPFTFTPMAAQENIEPLIPSIPYTVSSATESDYDTMDASLLMSSDYLQPLIPTDLSFLVEKIFSVDGASWLRHSAAKKYLQWRESAPRRPRDLYRPLAPPVPDSSSALTRLSQALTVYHRPQQGDTTAQFQMADWAAELQRSSINERLRYETLSRGERAVWLTEKLHECVQDGTLVAASQGMGTNCNERRRRGGRYGASKTQHHQDPLGLLQVAADLKAKGWKAVEVLSSLGLVGLAFWISRHGWPTKAVELVDEWMGF
ncbi:Septin-domain-containing protein [Xylaria flabelliformis]|nr:Septin-domain-containing protein [Xylaria flabelliformis]